MNTTLSMSKGLGKTDLDAVSTLKTLFGLGHGTQARLERERP